ncbi:Cmi7p LALA0_S01e09670g [Lachancea lanzarotensis]|uniref:LALA0S01e09670g1_1 n=1 Tax=Lachancea lanzarotensis TaxID=1245769 RepID=A0A0C7MY44_9SACH|nr:uncharacterized protein LALA0_S01e09670g [Lachancea lanzarotensis]CEP60390.1 LALA0S01e09670g1_1 [Lachancea lanzarotensis]
MSADQHTSNIESLENTSDFLDTFKQLQEGEKTAEKLEKMLDQLEGKLDDLLSQTQDVSNGGEKSNGKIDSMSDE